MIVPRRLYSTVPYEQATAETLRAEGEEERLYLICAEGSEIHDQDAAKLGIAEYLSAHPVEVPAAEPVEEKAVEQGATENKAISAPSEVKAEDAHPGSPPPPDPSDDPGQPGEIRIPRGGRRGP